MSSEGHPGGTAAGEVGAAGAVSHAPLVFVSDPSADAERVARALRASGFGVVDVPLSMLVARVAVQRPDVVVVDADSHGALDIVARMRELPDADDVHIFFVALPGGVIASLEDAHAHEANGLAVRPVDVGVLVREIELASGGARPSAATSRASTPPPSIAIPVARASSPSPVGLPALSANRGTTLGSALESARFSEPAGSASPSTPAPRLLTVAPPVSLELLQRLSDAEQRVQLPSLDEGSPSPEQEIDAVLPAELLSALDEPLDEDEESEDEPLRPNVPTGSPPARERTTDGGAARTTGASTGSGSTPISSIPERRGHEDTLTPPPWGARTPSAAPPSTYSPATREPSYVSASHRAASPSASPPPDGRTLRPSRPDLGFGEALRVVGSSVASRTSGSLCIFSERRSAQADAGPTAAIERRVVLREGDIVTCASSADDESLMAFLGARGDLPRETVRRLASKFPAQGRHAGAALVARGYLIQDQMWPTLRAHAEWVLGRVLSSAQMRVLVEPEPPPRLAGEPSVFGGVPGAAVFVDVVRRVYSPAEALERLGGAGSRLGLGASGELLVECGLAPSEHEAVRAATSSGRTVGDVLEEIGDMDFASALLALTQLGVADVLRAVGSGGDPEPCDLDGAAIEAEAIRERVRARLQLVEDGDYFAVLGVARDATGYEVKRAFLELRRAFDPSRLPSPELSDLAADVQKITTVLEEAFEVLRDGARRERYRRAIEGVPSP